jgi:hypothetical protein
MGRRQGHLQGAGVGEASGHTESGERQSIMWATVAAWQAKHGTAACWTKASRQALGAILVPWRRAAHSHRSHQRGACVAPTGCVGPPHTPAPGGWRASAGLEPAGSSRGWCW